MQAHGHFNCREGTQSHQSNAISHGMGQIAPQTTKCLQIFITSAGTCILIIQCLCVMNSNGLASSFIVARIAVNCADEVNVT